VGANIFTTAPRMSSPSSAALAHLLTRWSLEITAKDRAGFAQVARGIAPGTQVSVTWLPGDDETALVQAAAAVREAGLVPVPHLSARRVHSKAGFARHLAQLVDTARADQVFVVAGDLPQPAGPYPDALALIRSGLLETHGITRVGIAGYPEGHPGIATDTLWAALDEKTAALRGGGLEGFIMTQFGFEAAPILRWLGQLRGRGIDLPVRVGVPGPASLKTLLHFAARCGVEASAKVLSKYGLSAARLLRKAAPDALLRELAAGLDPGIHGQVHLHVYPFGGLPEAVRWINGARAGQGR